MTHFLEVLILQKQYIMVNLAAAGEATAAEAAVALAIILNIFNNLGTVNIDEANQLKQ